MGTLLSVQLGCNRTDGEEIALIDQWYTENKVMGITTATEQEGECFPYFSHYPAFGLPAEVVDCHVMVR